jgi:hypothetical protein
MSYLSIGLTWLSLIEVGWKLENIIGRLGNMKMSSLIFNVLKKQFMMMYIDRLNLLRQKMSSWVRHLKTTSIIHGKERCMKKWTVRADSTTTYEAEVEANTQEEAWDMALNLDGSLFCSLDNADWNVYDVVQTEEEEE